MTEEVQVELLREIRDALNVIAEANFEQFRAAALRRLGERAKDLASGVTTETQWEALTQMDGTRSQSELAQALGVTSGYMSKLVARLKGSGLVKEAGAGPIATFSKMDLRAVRETYGR